MVGRKQKTAVVEEPPKYELVSLEQEALERRMAQARLDDDRRKLDDIQRTNFQTHDGRPKQMATPLALRCSCARCTAGANLWMWPVQWPRSRGWSTKGSDYGWLS